MEDQEAFEKGRQAACAALSGWQEMGYSSLEVCRTRLRRLARYNLRQAEQAMAVAAPQWVPIWHKQVMFQQGYLAALYRECC